MANRGLAARQSLDVKPTTLEPEWPSLESFERSGNPRFSLNL